MRSILQARVQFPYDEHKSSYFSLIPLGIFEIQTLDNLCMLVFLVHHSNLQLAYITQAWIQKFKNLCHASKYMKCTFKCNIQVYELAPPTCVLKILIDLFPLSYISYLSPYVKYSPIMHISVSLILCQQLAQKVSSNYRQVGVKPCEMRIIFLIWFNLDHLQKIFNSV